MDWLVYAIIGICGTGWPRRFPGGGGGGGGFDPDNPWPPNCPMCGALIGAISAVVVIYLVGPQFANAGFIGTAIISFAAGSAGNTLVGGLVGLMRRGSRGPNV
jgi:hypothetical protein